MESIEFPTANSAGVLWKIDDLVKRLILATEEGTVPAVKLASYSPLTVTPAHTKGDVSSVFQRTEEATTLSYSGRGAYKINVLFRVLQICQQLIQQNTHATKRDVYYMDPMLFRDQAIVDRAISQICILFECSRSCLHLVSGSKGLVMGPISYAYEEQIIDGISTATTVPVHVDQVTDIRSSAAYILLVEKETVFERLANDNFCEKNCCILLTGKGYPDVATRSFLRLLTTTLKLPIYGLVDGDPYGIDILSIYRFGSLAMAYEAETLAVTTVRWLGLFSSDFKRFNIPKRCLLPMSKRDHRKADMMLKKSYLTQLAPAWRSQLEAMRASNIKLKIEAISAVSFSQLAEVYIPTKIQDGPI